MTNEQSEQLLTAAITWQEQGPRSKWKSEVSLKLWDTVAQIKEDVKAPEEEPPVKTLISVLVEHFVKWLIQEWK